MVQFSDGGGGHGGGSAAQAAASVSGAGAASGCVGRGSPGSPGTATVRFSRRMLPALFWLLPALACGRVLAADLASVQVRAEAGAQSVAFDGNVQAIRQTVIASQVSGAVVALLVKAGDTVKAGQVLVRLDARAAEQNAAAGEAQVQAARASEQAAVKEFERQKQLFKRNYISQAALDRAEAQYKAAQAAVLAQRAGAGVAHTNSGFYTVKAPYAGRVAELAVVQGDMAMPGKPLLTLFDPEALRVSVNLPKSTAMLLAGAANGRAALRVQLPDLPAAAQWLEPASLQLLPTVDPATHTQELRIELPAASGSSGPTGAGQAGPAPGMFARVWISEPGAGGDKRLYVPTASVVQRAELTAVYVIGEQGKPSLRQVRLGRAAADRVEILAGVSAGERVALDPQAASRVR